MTVHYRRCLLVCPQKMQQKARRTIRKPSVAWSPTSRTTCTNHNLYHYLGPLLITIVRMPASIVKDQGIAFTTKSHKYLSRLLVRKRSGYQVIAGMAFYDAFYRWSISSSSSLQPEDILHLSKCHAGYAKSCASDYDQDDHFFVLFQHGT